jgi:hypothetical protein
MKGKINVSLVLNEGYNNTKSVQMKALLKIKNPQFEGTNYGVMEIDPKHQVKPNTAVSLGLSQGKVFKLDDKKRSDRIILTDVPAEFIKGTNPEGEEYMAILCNLNKSKTKPMMRIFYLDYSSMEAVKDYGSLYEFTEGKQIDEETVDTPEEDGEE